MNPFRAVPALLRAVRFVPALAGTVRLVPARLRHGRPWRLAARITGALVLAGSACHSGAGPAAISGVLAGITVWLALSARGDVAPPPGR